MVQERHEREAEVRRQQQERKLRQQLQEAQAELDAILAETNAPRDVQPAARGQRYRRRVTRDTS